MTLEQANCSMWLRSLAEVFNTKTYKQFSRRLLVVVSISL